MEFESPLILGRLCRRYKRFLADVALDAGEVVTAHCPNTGAMTGCAEPGFPVWLRPVAGSHRKYPWTWEIVEPRPGTRVGINTGRSNALVAEALAAGDIAELRGYRRHRREVKFGSEGSRVDFVLEADGQVPAYVEVKNVTAAEQDGVAYFPDAVTARGQKHLRELQRVVQDGKRAVVLYCVQRDDVFEVRPADHVDPDYGRALRTAMDAGVEVFAYRARVDPAGIRLYRSVGVVCP